MVASIPNDIFQYSLITAVTAGLTNGGPIPPMLTSHGTHGIGIFSNTDNSLVLLDSVAYCIGSDGRAQPAPRDANLPFTMVTVFAPTFRAELSGGLKKDGLRDLFASGGKIPSGKNTPMPFRIEGAFSSVEVGKHTLQEQGQAAQTLKDVKGTIFGFVVPSWAQGISGKGVQSYFLSAEDDNGVRRGGYVKDFEAGGKIRVDWAKCGRFHLGFPQTEEWETVDFGS